MKRSHASKRRLTPKERVLAVYPTARECYTYGMATCVGIGIRHILGSGHTWRQAWADAARRLRE